MSIETRILAVVDVYDALVSDRVYRAGLDARARVRAARGESHAYDQTVVAALSASSRRVADVAARRRPVWPAWRRTACRTPAAPTAAVRSQLS